MHNLKLLQTLNELLQHVSVHVPSSGSR